MSCAILHHVQVGEVDSEVVRNGKKFEVIVSETGINLDEATEVVKLFGNKSEDSKLDAIKDVIQLFQMGPTTGNPIYTEPSYADNLVAAIYAKCSGKISGIMAIRETNKYPVVSGEIVKIVGYCQRRNQ